MIVIGYQGIGKSTLAKKLGSFIIDLESSWMKVNGERMRNWADIYCQIAAGLSQQGFIVMVSSHAIVQSILAHCPEKVMAIYPSLDIKDEWIERLRVRYEDTGKEKDLLAWRSAEEGYVDQIGVLRLSPFVKREISDMDYDLLSFILDESSKK